MERHGTSWNVHTPLFDHCTFLQRFKGPRPFLVAAGGASLPWSRDPQPDQTSWNLMEHDDLELAESIQVDSFQWKKQNPTGLFGGLQPWQRTGPSDARVKQQQHFHPRRVTQEGAR
jgi:hypothetical protein